ncbi:MAG: DNA repair protein RadC [Prevotella sp.]|nr:DNA repair protein RadC [Prevotella sp.]MBR4650533.1 DNA repair protein RadC [Prevotella sp.]
MEGIKKWDEADRPREKLMRLGAEALSNAELLAILIGSGNQEESAVDLMKHVLSDCNNNLAQLSKMSLPQLMGYNGIGEAKAITILAACELGKRREGTEMPERRKFVNSRDIYTHLWPRMRDLDVEESYLILMNQGYKEIKTLRLSHGGITETAVDVRLVMKEALLNNATVIALAHNHPSGNLSPSRDDEMLTKKISEACRTMRIHFLDHVIITDGQYYSFRDNNKI